MRDHMRTRLRDAPFNLNESSLDWVFETFDRLIYRQRIAQLFNLRGGVDAEAFRRIKDFEPGGITAVFGHDPEAELANVADIGNSLQVPPLVSADLEGSRMSLPFGTQVTNPLGLAAINDLAVTAEASRIMATEARTAGINWSFTPVLDINAAFRSAIVATRGFGSDPDLIERHALTQIAVFQENGIAATAKHWPGEGFDDRDQHLLTTVNPLSFAEWERSFGKLYRAAINAGVLSVMSGHIAFPAFIRAVDPEAQIEAFQPASLSARLNLTLLRDTLGFNGLIVSDATGMAGLGSWCRTVDAMPLLIAAGCDMILFSQDPSRDAQAVGAAIERGEVSKERFDEAVLRVLGLKAALGLHKATTKPKPAAVRPSATDSAFAAAVAARSPTLVKDTQNLLPLGLARHRRVLVISPGIIEPWAPAPIPFAVPRMLAAKGFHVTAHEPGMAVARDNFDLLLYLFGEETLLTRGRIGLDWLKLNGNVIDAMKRHWHDIPTLMISFGYPYMLYDAPRMPTYINAYSTLENVQAAVVELLIGNGTWNRHSPIDPFCGMEDARY